MLKGCDISKWQGQPDFVKLQSAVDFVIIRSSYGNGFTDSEFQRNRVEARRAGMARGFYHYAYPNHNKPKDEADWFLKVIGQPDNGDVLALDFEESYSDPVGWCLAFLKQVSSKLSGYKPLLYINFALNNAYDWKPVVEGNYGLWLARWDFKPTAPAPQTDWSVVAMRQYSNNSKFAGIVGNVDGNVFYGNRDDFKKHGVNPSVEPDPQLPSTPKITDQTKIPQIVDEQGNPMEVQAIRSALKDMQKALENAGTTLARRIKEETEKVRAEELKNCNERVETAETTLKTQHNTEIADLEVECETKLKDAKLKYEIMVLKKVDGLSSLTLFRLGLKKLFGRSGK